MTKGTKRTGANGTGAKKPGKKTASRRRRLPIVEPPSGMQSGTPSGAEVLDRLWTVVTDRRGTDPAVSHSARLLSRGTAKIAQKFGEEAVECLIEAVARNREALISESADVLYHLIVLWVDAGIRSEQVWHELNLREGISGVAEKASRARSLSLAYGLKTTKIP